MTTGSRASLLRPYLPRLTFEWLGDDPNRRWRSLDGTVVFVDISGFTKLSEKLAKSGKVGAEEMADAINNTFTELLAIAYEEDGSLLKFGGDALLLLFTGGDEPRDHALRAVRAAAGMRRRLRTVGKIQTTRGQVGLRMSVGVHTGTYDFFLVGESHRELLATGPGATQVVTMEGTAEAGEILLSPSTAALLPARCVGEPKGPGFLLKATPPGEPAGLVSVIPSVSEDLLESCVSVANREQLLAGSREPEHRQASVAFLHFDGTDEMRQQEGLEHLADSLHELVVCVQEAVDELQVSFLASDVDADGGKIIMTAGVPRSVGDDEERMLLALRRITDADVRMPFRIGVNHGPVFSGDIGPRYRRTYTVMGDTVNLAARVMSKAPPGELYATGSILDRSSTRFELTEIEPFMVKGKAKPVQAWAVGVALGSKAREVTQARRLPLIGRDAEILTLERLAVEAQGGRGHLVEIVGEPGIGKTRLLEELVEGGCGLRAVHATAEAYTSSTSYATWRELLPQLVDLGWQDGPEAVATRLRDSVAGLDRDLLPWVPLLADVLDLDVPSTPEVDALAPEFRRPKLHEVVRRYLAGTVTAPTLVRIEDGHQMDPASSELLASLVPDLGQRRWLIAVARRDIDTGFVAPEDDLTVRLDLGPLPGDATRALLLAATEDAPLLPHDEELIATRSGGNAQFLLDLILAVASGSMLPDSVEAAATARIDSLAPADRALVRRVSVFGVSFHPRHLVDVLDEETPAPDDRTWARLGEFFEDEGDGSIRFRRAVVREAAYEGLPFRVRRRLHEAIGSRLEREAPDPDDIGGILSLHFFLAGDHPRAYRYARIAADRAAERYENEEASHLYRRAIDAVRRVPGTDASTLGELHERRANALADAGNYRDAIDACAAACRSYEGDPFGQGRVLYRRSRIEYLLGRASRSLFWATRSRSVLAQADDPGAPALAAEVGAWYASVLQGLGRNTESSAWSHRAIEEAEGSGSRVGLAEASDVLDSLNFVAGRPTGTYWEQALAIFEALGDLRGQQRILTNLGAGCYSEGRWDDAMRYYERAREVGVQSGNVLGVALVDHNMGEIAADRGWFEEGEALLRSALRVWRASGVTGLEAISTSYLGRIAARSGRMDEAFDLYRQAEEALTSLGAPEEAAEVTARIAEAHTFREEPRPALERLAQIDEEAQAMHAPLVDRVRGYARAQLGDLEGASAAIEESLRSARARGAEFDVVQSLTAQIRLAQLRHEPLPAEVVDEANAILTRLRIGVVVHVPLPAT